MNGPSPEVLFKELAPLPRLLAVAEQEMVRCIGGGSYG